MRPRGCGCCRARLPGAGGRGGRGHGAGGGPDRVPQLGAAPDLARLEALAHREAAWKAHGLTERELQVLRLVATNHAIASQLFVAEKTVDRHVSNIFTKLGVSSRAAATAYAYQHRLL
jgi:DNA-binding NarL/FixJ family response regulator